MKGNECYFRLYIKTGQGRGKMKITEGQQTTHFRLQKYFHNFREVLVQNTATGGKKEQKGEWRVSDTRGLYKTKNLLGTMKYRGKERTKYMIRKEMYIKHQKKTIGELSWYR